jgi:predicted AlkP superfamily phosphohydrolase/phosphomutase
VLVLDSNGKGYDKVLISEEKNCAKTFANLSPGRWSDWKTLRFVSESQIMQGKFRFKLVELSSSGKRIKIYQSQVWPVEGWSFPSFISKELTESIGPYLEYIGPHCVSSFWIDLETYLEEIKYQALWIGRASKLLMEKYDWDLYMNQWHAIDHIQHIIWGGIDPICPSYLPDSADYWWTILGKVYQYADEMVGMIMEQADEETFVVVVSDHGHVAALKPLYLNNALIKAGLLKTKKGKDGEMMIDWSKTKAIAHLTNFVSVNLRGRDPQGIVDPKEFELVRDEIMDTLYNIKDPETGKHPLALILRKEEAGIIGMWGERIGDIVYMDRDAYSQTNIITDDLSVIGEAEKITSIREGGGMEEGTYPDWPLNRSRHGDKVPTAKFSKGNVSGVFIMTGPRLKKGYKRNPIGLVDVAPTLAYMLDIAPPKNSEGKILWDIIS